MRVRQLQQCDRARHTLRSRATAAGRAERGVEHGFTLIELVIVAAIIPLIIGAIAAGLITVLNLQSSVTGRLQDTSDAQQVSATFQKDVQSATAFTTNSTSAPQCGTGSQLLGMQWNGGQTVVSYMSVPIVTGTGTTYSLVRQDCTSGGSSTPTNSTTVSFDLAGPSAAIPQYPPCLTGITCTPDGTVQDWTVASGVPGVPGVKFVVNEAQSKFIYTLEATSRAFTPQISANIPVSPAFAPLTLLSSGSNALTIASDAEMTVNPGIGTNSGTVAIASTMDNSVVVSDDAGLGASMVLTEDPTLQSVEGFGSAKVPSTTFFAPQISDPLQTILKKPLSYAPSTLPKSCTNPSGLTYTCKPGYYTADPGFPSGATVTFTGGLYEFTNSFVIPPSATMTFKLGNYIFDGSPAISPPSSGSPVTIIGNNVLFYIPNGTVDFGDNTSVNLTPINGNDGATIWDAASPSTINLSNIQSNRNSYGGIYVPQGTVSVSSVGLNGNVSAMFIIANNVTVATHADITLTGP